MFHRPASFLPCARSPPERRESGSRKSRLLPALTRLKKHQQALLHGASAPPPNPVPRQPEGSTILPKQRPRKARFHPYINLPLFHPKSRPSGLINMSQPSYLNGLDCAPFFAPWAQSNRVFFNSYICFIHERAQSGRKTCQVCAPFGGAVHYDHGPSMHHQAIMNKVKGSSEPRPKDGVESHPQPPIPVFGV